MKILAFAGSTSSTSINKQLVEYTSTLLSNHQVEVLDLNDFEVAIYSTDREEQSGIPSLIQTLSDKIDDADMLLISLAEHNGNFTAAFKNTFDWLSRVPERKAWGEKDMFLMATSPGGRGGQGVLEIASARFPRNGGNVIGSFSLPSFYDNFEAGKGITNANLLKELKGKITEILK